MIVENIKNLEKICKNLGGNFLQVGKFISENDISKLSSGKYEFSGKDAFLSIEEYDSKPLEECTFEGHKNYADIQLVISGNELFGYHDVNQEGISIKIPYDTAKDVEKYDIVGFSNIVLTDGMFAIVFPNDLHLPKVLNGKAVKIKKAVFKVKL